MKGLSIILGLVLFSVISTSAEARSHFSLNFSNFFASPPPVRYMEPAPVYAAPVYAAPTYVVESYQPMYMAPQSYYREMIEPEVVYMRPAPRPVVMREVRRPAVSTGIGFSWNFR